MYKVPGDPTPSSSPLVRGRGVLALDIGNRYIGVAATDHVDEKLAYRYATIDRKTQGALAELAVIVEKESIHTLVLGIPYHMEDGSETQQTRKTREFISQIKEKFGANMDYVEVDETLTSRAAKDNLLYEGVDVEQEHAEAARIMLQEYLSVISSPAPVIPAREPGSKPNDVDSGSSPE